MSLILFALIGSIQKEALLNKSKPGPSKASRGQARAAAEPPGPPPDEQEQDFWNTPGAAARTLHFTGEHSRKKSILSAVLVLVGGFLFRFDMVRGGKMSADDPEATFTFARSKDDPPRGG